MLCLSCLIYLAGKSQGLKLQEYYGPATSSSADKMPAQMMAFIPLAVLLVVWCFLQLFAA